MKQGISLQTQIPMRSQPSEKSEMVSQVLFGETFNMSEISGSWIKIILHDDDYTGWVDGKMVTPLSDEGISRIRNTPSHCISNMYYSKLIPKGRIVLSPGSKIPSEIIDDHVFFDDFKLQVNDVPFISNPNRKDIITSAEKWMNSPYLWGGKTPFGFDCSGYVQVIFKTVGISIPRDSSQQANSGYSIDFLTASKPGDLAFFDNEEGTITHVGIIHSDGNIIHCSGNVKIDKIDQQGIYDRLLHKYTHHLRLIRRIYPEE